ncbi:uncharacterized protein ACA1_061230 [Acanthamoeba castellanii str. Neff]|uniref:Uncharacterized protein n=1 Tax=Acanthamoeba castellanii (strain ATCC 30010 / Neff) TaxID=1257118 RepID=L8GWK1_ACACF|nr:uncharacterized protein ACA1_061230 [Acanthamoeba castellanii str. Neff]ELR17385.1 hypothetical protein ACA1_061230 [Acanthamoeba castellanii str. Neff]
MAVRQPRVVQGLMHVRALKAVATYGMTLVLTEKVDEHSSVVSAALTASPVPPLVLPASLSEPALLHARGRIGGRGGPLLKEPKKMKKRKIKKEQLIQRHILHHAAPNLSSLRFASKERQQASIALRDKLMKRPSRDELIRRRIIRPIAPSTSTTTTTMSTPTATAATSLKPGGQQQQQRVVTMLTSSSPAASTPGLRKSGTAAIDTPPTHAAAASKKSQAQQAKSSKQAQAQKQKQILLPIDNSSRHHEYHGEQLSDLDRQEKKKNNRHKWFHGYVPYVKKREDEDVNDVPYYSLASSSGLGASGGAGKKKTPRRRKKNRRRCESMVQLPPELLLAFAEEDYDDDLDRRRRVQRELYTLAAAKESESVEVVDISDAHGGSGGGVGGGLSVAGVGGLLGTSPGLGFEPHSPTLDRWEEMQVALGDRETVTSTPRRRPRGQLVKKNKSEREISFHQRSTTDIDVPPQPPMQQLPGNNLKQSHLLHPHHGGAAAQAGASTGKGAGALHVSSGRVKRHARSHSRDSKSSEALRHYHGHGHNAAAQQPPKPHGREDEYEPEESPEEEEESSYDEEEEEAESHIFGAWMGRRSGSHARRKGKGSNILKQRSDDSWKWKASS